jgi:TonB family protein
MTIRIYVVLALTALVLWPGLHGTATAGDLTTAKSLYASAAYEEALAQLEATPRGEDAELIDQYRALCLLALGRASEAEGWLKQIVERKPLYKPTDADVSPRLVTLFDDVRKRALPAVAKTLYGDAKASFDAKRYDAAAAQFRQLLAVVREVESSGGSPAATAELAQLAEGFLTLADANLAPPPASAAVAAAPPASALPAPSPALSAAVPPSAPIAPMIYSTDEQGVKPPQELERVMPRWIPATSAMGRMSFSGTLDIVIDERGRVESAKIVQPVAPDYDAALLRATTQWRYLPAQKDGKPVKFRMKLAIALRPMSEE